MTSYSSSDDDLPSFDILSKKHVPHRTPLSQERCVGSGGGHSGTRGDHEVVVVSGATSLGLGLMIPATSESVCGGSRKRPHCDPVVVLDDPVERKRKEALVSCVK